MSELSILCVLSDSNNSLTSLPSTTSFNFKVKHRLTSLFEEGKVYKVEDHEGIVLTLRIEFEDQAFIKATSTFDGKKHIINKSEIKRSLMVEERELSETREQRELSSPSTPPSNPTHAKPSGGQP